MSDIDLTEKLRTKLGTKYRKVGRYSVSDLYAMQAGWLTPYTWLHPEPVDFTGLMNMMNGIVMHEKIQMLYSKEDCEIKKVIRYKDIEIVGKCDYLPKESIEIWDFKTSSKVMDKMKPWARHQIKMYCSMFDREVGKIYQPVTRGDRIYLKDCGSVERDDPWYERELERLYQFHLKVKEIYEKENHPKGGN